jgi:hypothetical protein
MGPYILVIFFAMTPFGAGAGATTFTKMYIELDSRIECEAEAEKLQEFRIVTPVGTFELGADCFSAAPESDTHEYNEDLYPNYPLEQEKELNNDKISI